MKGSNASRRRDISPHGLQNERGRPGADLLQLLGQDKTIATGVRTTAEFVQFFTVRARAIGLVSLGVRGVERESLARRFRGLALPAQK
jgi:hypothetical protein